MIFLRSVTETQSGLLWGDCSSTPVPLSFVPIHPGHYSRTDQPVHRPCYWLYLLYLEVPGLYPRFEPFGCPAPVLLPWTPSVLEGGTEREVLIQITVVFLRLSSYTYQYECKEYPLSRRLLRSALCLEGLQGWRLFRYRQHITDVSFGVPWFFILLILLGQ